MVGINDGLGYEELGQIGSQVASVWLTGSLLVDDQISGANIYSTGTIQGENVYGDTTVSGPTIKGTTYSGTNYYEASKGLLHSVIINSGTAVYGAKIIAGSGLLGTGSNVWITYPVAFTSTPTVLATNNKTISKVINTGSFGIGSFYVEGEAASDNFSWIAVGI